MVYAEEVSMTSRLMDFCYEPNLNETSNLNGASNINLNNISNIKTCREGGGLVRWSTYGTNQLVWALLTIATSFVVNTLPVKVRNTLCVLHLKNLGTDFKQWYGRIEHVLGLIKMTGLIIVVIISQLVILGDAGKNEGSASKDIFQNFLH